MLAHLGALDRHLGANMSQHSLKMTPRCQKNAILETILSQHRQRQPPRCLSHPFQAPQKCKKTKKTKTVFQCFSLSRHGAKIHQKCSQNHSRSSQVESKMAVLPLSWSISELMLAHLGALAHHLASLVRHLGANMCNNSKQKAFVEPTSAKTAPKIPKTKENLIVFDVFHSPAMRPKSTKNAPRTMSEAPKLRPKWQSCCFLGPS